MKNKLYLLLITPILFATGCGQSSSSKKIDVVIISGQSNAVGCTYIRCLDEAKYAKYSNGYPEIQIAYDCWTVDKNGVTVNYYQQNSSKESNFVDVALGQGNNVSTFGPEIGIAEALHEKYANKLCLIKLACGASNLKYDWMTKSSRMHVELVNYVQKQIDNLKKKGYNPTIKAFCWMQGEGDSYEPEYFDTYQSNLRRFVNAIRSEFKPYTGEKDLPFIDAGISNASVWPMPEKVNDAKRAFAEESENNYFIDTIAAGLHTDTEPPEKPDLAHYDSESEIMLGHLFAQYFEPFLEPVE